MIAECRHQCSHHQSRAYRLTDFDACVVLSMCLPSMLSRASSDKVRNRLGNNQDRKNALLQWTTICITICMANGATFISIQMVIVGPGLAVCSPPHICHHTQDKTPHHRFILLSLVTEFLSFYVFCYFVFVCSTLIPFILFRSCALTGKYSCTLLFS